MWLLHPLVLSWDSRPLWPRAGVVGMKGGRLFSRDRSGEPIASSLLAQGRNDGGGLLLWTSEVVSDRNSAGPGFSVMKRGLFVEGAPESDTHGAIDVMGVA